MEVKGKVIQVLPLQTGMGKKGQWKKQEFILETQAQYPKKICLSVWGDKVEQFNVATGDIVNASIDLESREYNGRWYTEVRAWKLERSGNEPASEPMEEPFPMNPSDADDMPF